MSPRRVSLHEVHGAGAAVLRDGFARLRAELEIPDEFPDGAVREAEEAAARATWSGYDDLTDLPFFTIDPPGSTDLDQAMCLQTRPAGGFRVHYAIADVAAFVRPGSALDAETRRRVLTYYSPDQRNPLHPTVLSEGAASLLPGETRPSLVWTFDLDADGRDTLVGLRRALVRSRCQLDYVDVQRRFAAGEVDEPMRLLADVGRARLALAQQRGAVDLPIPEQQVESVGDGFRLRWRVPSEVEDWNAQVSLMTGMAAARLMLDGGVGVLRTLPPPPPERLARVRALADGRWPRDAATLEAATTVFRGAGYAAFEGQPPEQPDHAAVAAPYAHATAPLRRLVDRYVGEACLALHAGDPVPEWVRAALPTLPERMAAGDQLAGALDRECVALVEAVALRDAVGQEFDGVVVDVDSGERAEVVLTDPAVRARLDGRASLGERVRVRLVEADVDGRTVRFEVA